MSKSDDKAGGKPGGKGGGRASAGGKAPAKARGQAPASAPGATEGAAGGGERIAKVLARRGVASRRTAEAMIAEGRVTVNGRVIESPALNVTPRDVITVDGRPLPEAEPPRLWLYHKPLGLVTSEKDEKGRPTVFAALPPEMGRVVSVGRLDLNSEGLLLLTNDGGLKRRLELPSTGWLRRYRVRVHGAPSEAVLEPLRKGITVDGERFQPMEVSLDRQQGANAWLTVGLREGKNREVRRAMEAVGLTVNRLIRISYGPFQLGEIKPGEVEEVRRKVLRDQLGADFAQAFTASAREPGEGRAPRPKGRGSAGVKPDGKPHAGRGPAGAKPDGKPPSGRGPAGAKPGGKPPAGRGPAGTKRGQPSRGSSPPSPRRPKR
jgi:23S rRNA pseudouridine2605 synthase